MYVLAYSWIPEKCYGNPSFKGCNNPNTFWKKNFVVSGLWLAESATGIIFKSCTIGEPYDRNTMLKVGWDDLVNFWPNVELSETESDFQNIWQDNWDTYGRCSGLSQYDYFKSAIDQYKLFPTPQSINDALFLTDGVLEKDALQSDFGGMSDHSFFFCHSIQFLSEVRTCWSKGLDGKPEMQIACPKTLRASDTCTSGVLTLMSF